MTWVQLFSELERKGLVRETTGTPSSVTVTGVTYDSRRVERGHVFVALQGRNVDGAAFAAQAIERGATAVVSESPAPAGSRAPSRLGKAPVGQRGMNRPTAQPHTDSPISGVTAPAPFKSATQTASA